MKSASAQNTSSILEAVIRGRRENKRNEINSDPRPFTISRNERKDIVNGKLLRRRQVSTDKRQQVNAHRHFKDYLVEFCQNASIPGLKYLVEQHRTLTERLLWFAALVSALVFCFVLIVQTLVSWATTPVILAMDRTMRSVWQVPFPAVTVCPISKIRATKFKFTDVAKNMRFNTTVSQEDLDILSDTALQCENIPEGTPGKYKNSSTVDRIEELSFDMESMAVYMSFRNTQRTPNIMKRLITEEGLCYAFNMLPDTHMFNDRTFHATRDYLKYENVDVRWSPNSGYSSSSGLHAYPYRVLGAGTKESLLFVLKVQKDDIDDWCSRAVRGFKVVLHSPAEYPRPRQQAVMVPLDMEMQVGVRPNEVRADDGVRSSYSAAQRRCFYPDERRLRFFRQYTQGNCELECLANATLALCGCVEFHMPRDMETKICGAKKMDCCEKIASDIQALSANFDGGNFEVATTFNETLENCNCLPICSYLFYDDGRTSLSDFDIDSYQMIYNTSAVDTHYVRVIIYFKSSKYIPMLRIEHYKTLTLIANCGGLLGLCLGMSILSLIELIYWLLVRPWSNRKFPVSPTAQTTKYLPKSLPNVYIY